MIEYVGPKYRTLVANMSFGIYFAAAAGLLPWIAYWIADWKILSVVTAFPMIVAFLGPWLVPESARYLSFSLIVLDQICNCKLFREMKNYHLHMSHIFIYRC